MHKPMTVMVFVAAFPVVAKTERSTFNILWRGICSIAGRGALPGQHEAFQLLSEEAGAGAAAVTSAVEFLAVLHAQRHSRRIEYTAQVAGHGRHSGDTHNLFGLLLSLLLSGLSWTTCDMCGRGHGNCTSRRFFVSKRWWQQFFHRNPNNNNNMLLTIGCS